MKTVAVDFSAVDAGGSVSEADGVALETIRLLKVLHPGRFRFVFHTGGCPHPSVFALKGEGDRIVRYGRLRRLLCVVTGRFARADILYSPSGALIYFRTGMTLVTPVTDLVCVEYPHGLSEKTRNASVVRIRNLVGCGALFQCSGLFMADLLGVHFGVSPSACLLTPGLVVDRNQAAEVRAPSSSGLPAGLFFLCSASGEPRHNQETLIVAYGVYRHAAIEAGLRVWPLVFEGLSNDRVMVVRRRTEACGLSDVFFVSRLDDAMSGVGALLFPTLHDGWFGAIARALRSGIPVISHDDRGAYECFGDACRYADARNPLRLAEAMVRVSADDGSPERPARVDVGADVAAGIAAFASAIETPSMD